MANSALADFIDTHRDDLIGRCRAKVARRTAPPPTSAELDHGVPLFLSQLTDELTGQSTTREINKGGVEHGHELLTRGFTIAQVVHDYGDICQSITDLAVETRAPISTNDFRTLNRCLDDAIAGAVTEYARQQEVGRDADTAELWSLVNSASAAFDALHAGNVGINGATGAVLGRTLADLRAYLVRCEIDAARAADTTT